MPFHVQAHKESTEISYFVVVLNFVNGYIFNFQIRNQKHRRVESTPDSYIYFAVIRVSFLFMIVFPISGKSNPYRYKKENYSFHFVFFSTDQPNFPIFSPKL